MRTQLQALVVVALAASAGCSSLDTPSAATRRPDANEDLVLTVVSGADVSQVVIDASIAVIGKGGAIENIGHTDQFGEGRVKKESIISSQSPVVLVCKPPYFRCAALLVKEERLLEFDEFSLSLPPVYVQ